MNPVVAQSVQGPQWPSNANGVPRPALPERLDQRLEALHIAVVMVEPDGAALLMGRASVLERVIVDSLLFRRTAQQYYPLLRQSAGQAVALWPGLWLAPLPPERRRRAGQQEPVLAAVLLSPEILHCEQLPVICDAQGLDYQVTLSRLDAVGLRSPAEVTQTAMMLAWLQQDCLEIDRRLAELATLSQQLGESYEELSLLYKFSSNMLVSQSPAAFLTEACQELAQVVGLKWMTLLLSEDESRLEDLAGQLFMTGVLPGDRGVLRRIGGQLMARQASDGAPMIVEDSGALGIEGLADLGRNLLVVYLRRENHTVGVLFGCDKLDGSALTSIDSKLCNSLANSLSIFLENTMLYEDVQAMFLGTLHALTSAIDAKDSYTHGHSERVALMSRLLAEAAGLDAQTVERVYISGLIHDVGKIGVPEAVLTKPGRLTEQEFALIKMHPEIGARILKDIRQMADLIPGVLHHHERWDGRGYPHGLAGRDIPLFGRLICLADSFDAMSSNRIYRAPIAPEAVLEEILRCAGSQFDPELADVFVKLDLGPFHELIARHMNMEREEKGDGTEQ